MELSNACLRVCHTVHVSKQACSATRKKPIKTSCIPAAGKPSRTTSHTAHAEKLRNPSAAGNMRSGEDSVANYLLFLFASFCTGKNIAG